jgi:subtilase family serine protease
MRGWFALSCALLLNVCAPNWAHATQQLTGHVPAEVRTLGIAPTGRLPTTQRLNLVIGLPYRNDAERTALLKSLYDPRSPNYHKFLSPDEFTKRFGPSEADYQAIIKFAHAAKLTVTRTEPGRVIIDVSGTVQDIEKAFHVVLLTYQHPTEPRSFYAPSTEPKLDINNRVLYIAGLNNYRLPRPASGSAPDGNYWGPDFRRAYAPDSALTGTGQVVGLIEQEGFTPSDIDKYRGLGTPALPKVNVVPILLDNAPNMESPAPGGGGYGEAAMDIELALAMAPGLDQINVYITAVRLSPGRLSLTS